MYRFLCFKIILFLKLILTAGYLKAGEVIIVDSMHYSNVLGEIRNYRIFLPPGYNDQPRKKYPVIYFYHGWSQRYFGSTRQADPDKRTDNDEIADFVSGHEVIVVRPDGYNANPEDEYYVRPYNIGPVETYRQFPLYFPELVAHIDASYHTFADRNHRAIAGFSMGGFMAFWIGGKYPHLISAAGSFCGSPEFMVGPKDFPVEYHHKDMYANYAGVKVRLHYGNEDFIRAYHKDINNVWMQVMDHYETKVYDTDHSVCGLTSMFAFFLETFKDPLDPPAKWDHIDVYPDFSVWGYDITSDRDISGFTLLENVDKRGFRSAVREFLPRGNPLPHVDLSITTPPVYERDQEYILNEIDLHEEKAWKKRIRSDDSGRLKIDLNGSFREIGINKQGDPPNICIASVTVDSLNQAAQQIAILIKLLNKGASKAEGVTARLLATRKGVTLLDSESALGDIASGEIQHARSSFIFHVSPDSIEIEKFELLIRDNKKNEWLDSFEIPLRKDLDLIKNYEIADGRTVTYAKAGSDSVTARLGAGNGDGIPNPGESIAVLIRDQGRHWPAFLHTSDRYVDLTGGHARISDNWTAYDHVGGSAKYTIPVITSGCPEDHVIDFYASWWLPDYPDHIIKEGKVKMNVTGKDETPPGVSWVKISGDNMIQAKLYDGGTIRHVQATLRSKEDDEESIVVVLNDDGQAGDKVRGDRVFSKKISRQKFGLYQAEIEATDASGNKHAEKFPDVFTIH